MLAEDMEKSYLGYLVCRDFYRGADAATALTALGLLPSVLAATRLVVVWEDCDLHTALQKNGHELNWAVPIDG